VQSENQNIWVPFVLFSAGVHVLLFSLFLNSKESSKVPKQTLQWIEIKSTPKSVVEAGKDLSHSKKVQERQLKSTKNLSRSKISLKKLKSQFSFSNLKPGKTKSSDSEESSDWTNSKSYDGIGFVRNRKLTTRQISFAESLWRAIHRNIERNPYLSEYNHTGHVYFQFHVENGKILLKSLRASASDRVLKVIAARALRKAFANEHGDIYFPKKSMVINARFSWRSYKECETLEGIRGNFLSFCNYAENKRRSFTASERSDIWTKAILQHGFMAYEEIQKYNREENHRKFQFDPFEIYKQDPDWDL
tara:strand:+ start:2356 stop:3270 length:915 start_codon:yes stop_codon:yes gene_type:complete